jgi:hypothetical protein
MLLVAGADMIDAVFVGWGLVDRCKGIKVSIPLESLAIQYVHRGNLLMMNYIFND